MKRITRMLPEWEAAIPEWNRKRIAAGLSTEPADFDAFERGARECYAFAGVPWPGVVVRVASPLVGALAAPIAAKVIALARAGLLDPCAERSEARVRSAVRSAVDSAVDSAVRSAVRSAVDSAVGSAVGSAVYSAVDSAVRSAVRSAVGSAVDSAVGSAVRSAVDSAVGSAVDSAVDSALRPFWHHWFGGSLWAGWRAFYSFFFEVCGLDLGGDISARLAAYNLAESSAGYWWANKDFVMASDRPSRISLVDGQLHNETSMAIEWRDGWGLWMLHGVRVPEWLVLTPERDLDPAVLTKIDNAEVRREFVRKLGAERIVSALSPGAVDKATYRTKDGREHPYELHRLDVAGDQWSYLRMVNPSVGLTHFEGVPNECLTVQDALNFRNGLRADQISSDGVEWAQQGDVLLFPRGASKFQPFPAILT